MNERLIILLEKHLDNNIEKHEETELLKIISKDPLLKKEYNEQKRVKEVLKKMSIKNPSKEIWDGYWVGVYSQIERGVAWIAILIGAVLLIGYGSIEVVDQFFKNTEAPIIVKIGTIALVLGISVLLFSVIREKFFTSKQDKYKEIQR